MHPATVLLDISAAGSPLFFLLMQRRIRVAREEKGLELIIPLKFPRLIPVFLLKVFDKAE